MLSTERITNINKLFEMRLTYYKEYANVIQKKLLGCYPDEVILLKFLYATMPLSDGINYEFEVFLDYARHGALLLRKNIFAKEIEEDIFLNYVLYHRVNEEEISQCRTVFFEMLQERIKGKNLIDTILEVNYWCSEEVTYQSTDERTASAMTVFNSAYGRCGEESTFTVSALRSVGIPARQVYVPKWSHCDDNHAWVEVYVDKKWCFLGACEPEEVLNKGWFTNASSRAMLVHSRWFDMTATQEEKIGEVGGVTLINNLKLYAPTIKIKIKVVDKKGVPQEGVEVMFEILNYAEFAPIAKLITDKQGNVYLTTGVGSLHIVARYKSDCVSKTIYTKYKDEVVLILGNKKIQGTWEKIDMIAPIDFPLHSVQLNQAQKSVWKEKINYAVKKRQNKVENLFERYSEAEKQLVEMARGNYLEIQEFLKDEKTGSYYAMKKEMLDVLSEKDLRDAKNEVLLEHFIYGIKHKSGVERNIFFEYVLNPRIYFEPMTKYRLFIESYYSEEDKEIYRKNPIAIWEWIIKEIKVKDDFDYPSLTTSPVGCLMIKAGSKLSQKILFVAICRTLGVPARLNPIDLVIEYYDKGQFIPVESMQKKNAKLKLITKDGDIWVYRQNWTLGKWKDNQYTTLNLVDIEWRDNELNIDLEEGEYQLITANRLINGNVFVYTYTFVLDTNSEKVIPIKLREAKLNEMLQPIQLIPFEVTDRMKRPVVSHDIIKSEKNLLIWLEVSKEPTEHILNEIYGYQLFFKKIQEKICFFVKNELDLQDKTLSKVLKEMPHIRIYLDSFEENVELIARRMYVDPDKLPLIVVTQKQNEGIYATSGYNVGTGELLKRIWGETLE